MVGIHKYVLIICSILLMLSFQSDNKDDKFDEDEFFKGFEELRSKVKVVKVTGNISAYSYRRHEKCSRNAEQFQEYGSSSWFFQQ